MDVSWIVLLITFALLWPPLLYVLVQGSTKEWSEGLEAFSELVDEVTTEPGTRSWFSRIEGRWRGRGASLRVALGGGWIFALETKVTAFPQANPAAGGSSPSWTAELTSIREELAEWRNRGTLRIKGGRLEAWFPQEAQFDAKRLQRAAPLVARAAELLDRIAHLEGQSDRIRCPYCHDLLQSGGPGGTAPEAVTTCEGCHTAHHEACYAEAGCTILGCSHFGQRLGAQGEAESA